MASSKKSLKEQEQIKEGIIDKIVMAIFKGRTKKALDLFANDPKMKKSIKQINREKANIERGLAKYNLKGVDIV